MLDNAPLRLLQNDVRKINQLYFTSIRRRNNGESLQNEFLLSYELTTTNFYKPNHDSMDSNMESMDQELIFSIPIPLWITIYKHHTKVKTLKYPITKNFDYHFIYVCILFRINWRLILSYGATGLRERYRKKWEKIHKTIIPPKRVWLYGSKVEASVEQLFLCCQVMKSLVTKCMVKNKWLSVWFACKPEILGTCVWTHNFEYKIKKLKMWNPTQSLK